MIASFSKELPPGVQLEPSYQSALNRQNSVMWATYKGPAEMSFHSIEHPWALLAKAHKELIPRCWKAGIPVDVAALERGIKLHDALVHLDPKLLNFQSSEQLAALLTINEALLEGCSKEEAERGGKIVMATHPDVRPTTPEEIIIRAADLANLAGDFAEFELATHSLHREVQQRSGAIKPFENWLPGAYGYLRKFLYPMLELTPAARDQTGRSVWHSAVLKNISTIWAKTFRDARCIVDTTNIENCTFPLDSSHVLFVRVMEDESRRKRLLTDLGQKCPGDAAAFLVPGDARRIPLPDACAHEIIADCTDGPALLEAARVLRPRGLFRLRGTGETDNLSTIVLEARRAGFGYIGSATGGTEQCFQKLGRETLKVPDDGVQYAKTSDSLRGWAEALKDQKLPQFDRHLINEFRESMASRYERLRKMGLLRIPVHSFTVDSVLEHPNDALSRMPGGPLFVFLEPRDSSAVLPRWHGKIESTQLIECIQKVIVGFNAQDFLITLQPAFEILYNANIMVHPDGSVLAEFADGNDLPSRMNSKILFSAQRSSLTGLFAYSTEDPIARQLAYEVIYKLPGEGEGRERKSTPGYYEVALAKHPTHPGVIPLFFDYRRHPFFLGKGAE